MEEDMKDFEQGERQRGWPGGDCLLAPCWALQTGVCPTVDRASPRAQARHPHASSSDAAGRPATHKLRMLAKVTDMLSTQRLHNDMLDAGLLGAGRQGGMKALC